jgi:hypothetical protein
MGPHHDGYPPITSAAEAIDLGWSRTATGLLDEECASEVLANEPYGAGARITHRVANDYNPRCA